MKFEKRLEKWDKMILDAAEDLSNKMLKIHEEIKEFKVELNSYETERSVED